MACVLHASHRQEFPLLRDTVLQLFQTVQLKHPSACDHTAQCNAVMLGSVLFPLSSAQAVLCSQSPSFSACRVIQKGVLPKCTRPPPGANLTANPP